MDLQIDFLNNSHLRVYSDDRGIEQNLCDFFTFMVPGAQWMPMYKSGVWDGKTRLYNPVKKTLYCGLYNQLIDYCNNNDITYNSNYTLNSNENIDENEIISFINSLKLATNGKILDVREYQIDSIIHAIKSHRAILLSPTSSGKSLMLYCIVRWLIEKNKKILLLVPTTNLVEQLFSDFEDYSSVNKWDVSEFVQKIYSGFTKDDTHQVKISTWQSIYKLNIKYFSEFDVVLGDECHLYKAQSLSSILEKCVNANYRIGVSGTIDNKNINRLTLTGLFGPIHQVITTKELMDKGMVTNLNIKALKINYPMEEKKLVKGMKYQQELKYIITNPIRNKFICDLAIRTKGNTLVLFQFVEQHGKVIYEMIKTMTNRPVFYISGQVDAAERERIRKVLNTHTDAILIASVQTTSTGVNIPALDNVIFASPTKSIYRVLQSIGRVLRLKDGKIIANLYDIGDDLSYGKSYKNTTLLHFIERIKIYVAEQFTYKIVNISLG